MGNIDPIVIHAATSRLRLWVMNKKHPIADINNEEDNNIIEIVVRVSSCSALSYKGSVIAIKGEHMKVNVVVINAIIKNIKTILTRAERISDCELWNTLVEKLGFINGMFTTACVNNTNTKNPTINV